MPTEKKSKNQKYHFICAIYRSRFFWHDLASFPIMELNSRTEQLTSKKKKKNQDEPSLSPWIRVQPSIIDCFVNSSLGGILWLQG